MTSFSQRETRLAANRDTKPTNTINKRDSEVITVKGSSSNTVIGKKLTFIYINWKANIRESIRNYRDHFGKTLFGTANQKQVVSIRKIRNIRKTRKVCLRLRFMVMTKISNIYYVHQMYNLKLDIQPNNRIKKIPPKTWRVNKDNWTLST